jgi:hypothetical protein
MMTPKPKPIPLTLEEKMFLERNPHLTPILRITSRAVLCRDSLIERETNDFHHWVLVGGSIIQSVNHYFTLHPGGH